MTAITLSKQVSRTHRKHSFPYNVFYAVLYGLVTYDGLSACYRVPRELRHINRRRHPAPSPGVSDLRKRYEALMVTTPTQLIPLSAPRLEEELVAVKFRAARQLMLSGFILTRYPWVVARRRMMPLTMSAMPRRRAGPMGSPEMVMPRPTAPTAPIAVKTA